MPNVYRIQFHIRIYIRTTRIVQYNSQNSVALKTREFEPILTFFERKQFFDPLILNCRHFHTYNLFNYRSKTSIKLPNHNLTTICKLFLKTSKQSNYLRSKIKGEIRKTYKNEFFTLPFLFFSPICIVRFV